MTDRIEQIRKREAAATLGPWRDAHRTSGDFAGLITSGSRKSGQQEVVAYMAKGAGTADHRFIAHAREDIPHLLAENARLNAIVERLKEACWECHTHGRLNPEHDGISTASLAAVGQIIDNALACDDCWKGDA